MKKFFLFLVIFLLLVNFSYARKGVGIVINTQSEIVEENKETCIVYGIYNPWDENVKAALQTEGEINNILLNYKSEEKLIMAGTTHSQAIPVNLCFKVPKVYKDNCLIGNLLCEQKCDSQQVSYSGNVIVVEKNEQIGAVSGSQTNLGVSAPITIKVKCTVSQRNYAPLWISLFVLVLIAFVIWTILNKKKKQKQNQKENQSEKTN
ncbi:hypothetical protein HYX18_00925 [Candidatus Woesearchaeota archaeon]|nr:hypothetical protein [Candidatus Woesearchaeota archaeon]